jgi:hypothetical protein
LLGVRKQGTERSQCTTHVAGIELLGKGRIENGKRKLPRLLTFVTNGALLGIKPVGSDAEHVIALDADAMDDGTYDGAGLDGFAQATRRRSGGAFLGAGLSGHKRILARGGLPPITGGRHPGNTKDASFKDERGPIRRTGQGRAGRRINNARKEFRESRAALVRMKSLAPS